MTTSGIAVTVRILISCTLSADPVTPIFLFLLHFKKPHGDLVNDRFFLFFLLHEAQLNPKNPVNISIVPRMI